MAGKHQVVPSEEWIEARSQLLIKGKEFTRLRDELSRQRRDLPWEAVCKEYLFEGSNGKRRLPRAEMKVRLSLSVLQTHWLMSRVLLARLPIDRVPTLHIAT